MKEKQSGIVLFSFVYIDDGWYGDRHRVILSNENGEGFRTKTEAKKFTARLKNYTQKRFGHRIKYPKVTNNDISIADNSTLETYVYCGSGPSLSHTHHFITTNDLK